LYGDDLPPEEIAQWYADETEAYARLGAGDAANYRYGYHAWNTRHGFRHLPDMAFPNVLGFGSAYGDELAPIVPRAMQITIVEPSDAFRRDNVHGLPARHVKPDPGGTIPLADAQFDLITCLGVLHHVPNVSFVVGEFARMLKRGGYMLLREPITSMGDWRRPRRGLTKRERGIPLPILTRIVQLAGLEIRHQALCGFPLTTRVFGLLRPDVFNSRVAVEFDALLSTAFAWNVTYHPRTVFRRLRPTSVCLVLRKTSASAAD
jgi:SAM-dependent methyltransferase